MKNNEQEGRTKTIFVNSRLKEVIIIIYQDIVYYKVSICDHYK